MIDEALLRVLSAHTGRLEAFAHRPTRMTGGYWAAIYGFELARPPAGLQGPQVLRVMPNSDAAVRETIVQRLVAEQGYPTPRVVLDGFDEGLGGAFMVMEHVDGVTPLGDLGFGRAVAGVPKTLRRLPQQLSTATHRLHGLDPQPIIAALDLAGVDVATLGVGGHLAEIDRVARSSSAGFDILLGWLADHRPVLTPAVVCHGDIHPFNMLVSHDGSFNLLDWTNANLCRPEYDVGFTAALLRCAPLAVPRLAERPIAAITKSLANRFVDAYRAVAAPIDLDVVTWFEVLQYGRCLAAVVNARLTDDQIVGVDHPFQVSAPVMIRRVQTITDVTSNSPSEPSAGFASMCLCRLDATRHRRRRCNSSSTTARLSTPVRIRTAGRPLHAVSWSLTRVAGCVLPRQKLLPLSTRTGYSTHVNDWGASR